MARFVHREYDGDLLLLALLSCVAGAATGFVVAMFRIALQHADHWRDAWIARAHVYGLAGSLLTVAAIAALTGLAARLVERFSPYAAGSGIPRVEAVAKGELPPAPFSLLPVKFFGGWLAIGSGLALGREGPSVQMGASIGSLVAGAFRLNQADQVALLAACGGAGLATAFNAPIAGAVFVLEELIRRFDTRIAIAALGASCCAIAVARAFLGSAPDFQVEALPYSGLGSGLLFTGLGILAGFAGMAYNAAILGGLNLAARIPWRPGWRAALIGATVGMLAWFAAGLVGGGDAITQRTLSGLESTALLPLFFAVRYVLGPLSYSAGTWRPLCPHACFGSPARMALRRCLPVRFATFRGFLHSVGSSRHGGVFRGRGACPRDGHYTHHGAYGRLCAIDTNALGLLRGHGDSYDFWKQTNL
jgi:CIC family chloride channel protein